MSKSSNNKKHSKPTLTPTHTLHVGGAIRMPAEYFGYDSGRYYSSGAPELATPSCQRPASFGTIFPDGTVGPILRTQTGGRHRNSNHSHHSHHNANHTHMNKLKPKSKSKSKSRKLSLKLMSKKLERMSKRLSQKVKKMQSHVSMSL